MKQKKPPRTGHERQLTRQIGEHLVAAELGRRGYIATPFAGNVPMYDLLAANISGRAIPIQVKAINGGSWQFDAETFLIIEYGVDGKQIKKDKKQLPHAELLCIFVLLKDGGRDEFYIFHLCDLRDHCWDVYEPRGPNSKNPKSTHCAASPKQLGKFLGQWKTLEDALGGT